MTAPPPHDLHDRAARISVAVGVAVFSLKLGAWALTGSVALLSDALESVVNVVAAVTMLAALRVARRPADADHPFGHGKAEYLSAFFEGALIAVAAVVTVASAWGRLWSPAPVSRVGEGIAVSLLASLANGALGMYLLRISRRTRSLALEADGRHVLADVYTSAGVIVGVILARVTGWWRLDPLVAMAVAANILWVGWRLVRRSVGALLDGVPESIVIGLSLLHGGAVSLVAVAAVFLSNLPEGLSSASGMRRAGRSAGYVFGVWAAIATASGLASWAGYALFSGLPQEVIAATTAVAAGAVLAMVSDTMIPEAFEQTHDATGLITVLGFLCAFALSKLAE